MDKSSGLEGVARLLPGHPRSREPALFVVDEREQLLRGVWVALFDGGEDLCDVGQAAKHTPVGSEPRQETGTASTPPTTVGPTHHGRGAARPTTGAARQTARTPWPRDPRRPEGPRSRGPARVTARRRGPCRRSGRTGLCSARPPSGTRPPAAEPRTSTDKPHHTPEISDFGHDPTGHHRAARRACSKSVPLSEKPWEPSPAGEDLAPGGDDVGLLPLG
jgi:hypothetical protein